MSPYRLANDVLLPTVNVASQAVSGDIVSAKEEDSRGMMIFNASFRS
jgi:hypothetical protein